MKKRSGFILASVLVIILCLVALMGATALTVSYKQQLALNYIKSTKSYYLALTGINYIRNPKGLYWNGSVTAPNTQFTGTKKISFISPDDIEITRTSSSLINSNIKSAGTVDGIKKTILCTSGDEAITLDVWSGMNRTMEADKIIIIYDYWLPVTKWDTQ